jgi:phosphate transport system protein
MENYRIFDTELNKLNHKVIQMCSQVIQQVTDAVSALKENNLILAKEVIARDNDIDSLDIKIDKLCQKIFVLQQPVATDLRFIMSALKINNDLERVGDHAVSIAKRIAPLEDFHKMISTLGVDKVANQVVMLFSEILELVRNRDVSRDNEVFKQAAEIKEECRAIAGKILVEMMEKSDVVVIASNILGILNHLERIAGYATNITESITFVVEGEIIKHRRNY